MNTFKNYNSNWVADKQQGVSAFDPEDDFQKVRTDLEKQNS
jgi:hypothetical protein